MSEMLILKSSGITFNYNNANIKVETHYDAFNIPENEAYHLSQWITKLINPIDKAYDYVNELEAALHEIIEIQPLDVFGPMSDRMRRIAREALR